MGNTPVDNEFTRGLRRGDCNWTVDALGVEVDGGIAFPRGPIDVIEGDTGADSVILVGRAISSTDASFS